MAGDRLVLCYHAVSPDWPERYCVTPDALEAQMRDLLRRGYKPLTFADVVAAAPGERVFAATFDDAYSSVRDRALPLLDRLGVPGTVFAVARFAESGAPLDTADWDGEGSDELRSLDWRALTGLAEHGWEIGSHTVSHRPLTKLDDAELARELGDSRAACEAGTGLPCRSLAYPYGDFDARVAAAARATGYQQAATLFGGEPRRLEPLEWPRVGIGRHHGARAFRIKTSPVLRRARTNPAATAAIDALMRLRGRGGASRPSGAAA